MEINCLQKLANNIQGEVYSDLMHRILYATDASAYREMPLGVVYPRNASDVKNIICFARKQGVSLIPRAAGTSLAGQVVGSGLVVDISRYMNNILEFNEKEHWIRVEAGVILDQLHLFTKPYGVFFGPETSTANRCCLGGMVGNNSCGLHSLVYGSVREHLLEATVVLSDGSEVVLRELTPEEVRQKMEQTDLEGDIYRKIIRVLEANKNEILNNYPDPEVKRRNSGYALDLLFYSSYFDPDLAEGFNLCKLLAGSEGTLAFITELKLNLIPLPPPEKAVICVHCHSLDEAFLGNLVALKHQPMAVELMDKTILDLSKENITQNRNRFFVQGDPAAILVIELACSGKEELDALADVIEADLAAHHYGYAYPRVYGNDINRVWELRKAGLGLLSGMPGSAKPVSVIEDTAVTPERLPAYMNDFREMLQRLGLECVYHAHIATGELHLRPILDLKKEQDKKLFRQVAEETALLVRKHRGSLSGEHGDGRLRGEFIPLLFGEKVYGLMKEVKRGWDPEVIFNAGKIIDTPPMDQYLRFDLNEEVDLSPTYFDFSRQKGWLSAIEQCNGSGDCRKITALGGTMCPSFKATGKETFTTRARANILRELLTSPKSKKVFDQQEILELLENCISCKACKSECPSNVDMTRFKAEFLQHYYEVRHIPLRSLLIANLNRIQALAMIFPALYNFVARNKFTSSVLKSFMGFSPHRSVPSIHKQSLRQWMKRQRKRQQAVQHNRKVYLFADEFTNLMDVEIGIQLIELLWALGYNVIIPDHLESGRTALSKGLLKQAKRIARKNVTLLKDIITEETPLIGIEPSCILSFRDEYPDLVGNDLRKEAEVLKKHCLLYDEFLVREIKAGTIRAGQFTEKPLHIVLHGHCHQKSLASVDASKEMLSLPLNYHVRIIPSGCCGMAGAFGYEKKHYDLSMQIGEEVLLPYIRKQEEEVCICAPGTSCRQQIKDGTGREAWHPIEVLWKALKKA